MSGCNLGLVNRFVCEALFCNYVFYESIQQTCSGNIDNCSVKSYSECNNECEWKGRNCVGVALPQCQSLKN